MKISLEWLSAYLIGPLHPQTVADALTNGGLPCEKIDRHGDDFILDVEVTSNRSDCLSHIGVAREVASLLDRKFEISSLRFPGFAFGGRETNVAASTLTAVQIDAPELCPHYTAAIIRNVHIGPSPQWMVRRLEAIGIRPINNIVDVTNYVQFEMGQPLHAFDFDKLAGGRIVVRRAAAGEKLISIDGHERELGPGMLVIADAVRPVALAGVMGGRDSEVSDKTINIFLESARFEPLSVRKTGRTLAMSSDSAYRFERGIDPLLPKRANERAARLMLEVAGGELLAGVVEAGQDGYVPKFISLRPARVQQVLGIDLPTSRIVDALRRDHLNPVLRGDRIECAIPSYRLDLNLEIDLVEEVIRIIGYDEVPMRDEISIRLTQPDPGAAGIATIRSTLIAGGFFESVTFSFVSDMLARDFVPAEASAERPLMRAEHSVRKADANLRPSILPGLLESIRHNESAGVDQPRLFEIGSTFWNNSASTPVERRRVTLVGAGDVPGIRGVVETLLRRLDPTRGITLIPDIRAGFARGAAGRIEWGGKSIGYLGRIDRAVADKLSLREIPVAAELDLEPLLAGMQRVPQLKPLPKFPGVRRDVSLVVPEATRYEKIDSLIRNQRPPHMEDLQYVTTYRGKPLEKGQKSVTVTLVFRSPTETLVSEHVDASVQRVVEAAKKQGWAQRA